MEKFNLQPHLVGKHLELRPLRAEDFEPLLAAASDPKIWEQHPLRNRYERPVFKEYFDSGIESKGAFVVLDRGDGQIIGSSRFHGAIFDKKQIEIGFTFLARKYWGGFYNQEMKTLMLNHAFEYFERVVFSVGENNLRSQKALEKIGARLTGEKKLAHPAHGDPICSLIFEILKTQWILRP